jgi:hypothetical protein
MVGTLRFAHPTKFLLPLVERRSKHLPYFHFAR